MTDLDLSATLVDILSRIAPEARGATLSTTADLREELELDSMDFLKFIQGISEKLGVTVPESDYPQVFTLQGCVAYVKAHRQAA